MSEKTYAPKVLIHPSVPVEEAQKMQRESDAHYARLGITQEVMLEPKGYVWKFYRHGVEIPGGLQFI